MAGLCKCGSSTSVSQSRQDKRRVSAPPLPRDLVLQCLFLVFPSRDLCRDCSGIFVADLSVVIKKIDLRKKPNNDFIMNDVLMIRASRHTNIVNYIDSFLYKNELWVVLERVDGCLLTDVIRESPLSEGQIAAVSKEIVRGLQHLHKHGVIHRDITGDNVSLCPTSQVKLSMTHNLFSL